MVNPLLATQNLLRKEKVLKILKQKGKKSDIKRDMPREALPPGKRISKNKKVYWETRPNRSDVPGTKL